MCFEFVSVITLLRTILNVLFWILGTFFRPSHSGKCFHIHCDIDLEGGNLRFSDHYVDQSQFISNGDFNLKLKIVSYSNDDTIAFNHIQQFDQFYCDSINLSK